MTIQILTPEHLGSLHPYEQALTLLLAFGPFALLAVVIRGQRRRARAEEDRLDAEQRAGTVIDRRATDGQPHSRPATPS